MREEGGVIERSTGGPATPQRIASELRALGVAPGDRLLVHTSLSKLGWVPGGAQGVIEALIEAVGSRGLIVMPTFTMHLSDPAHWSRPPIPVAWHEQARATMPAFDPYVTPTQNMGVINELFRTTPGAVRGPHPQSSFAAWGEGAAGIVAPHELLHALDDGSPLGRLYEADAKVFFLGTTYETSTCFHLAEHRAGKLAARRRDGTSMRVHGERQWVVFETPGYDSDDFEALGQAFEAESDAVSIGKVGEAPCRLFRIRDAVDFGTAWLRANRP